MQVAMPEREQKAVLVYYILCLVAYKTFAYKTCHASILCLVAYKTCHARASGAEATRRKTKNTRFLPHAYVRQIHSMIVCFLPDRAMCVSCDLGPQTTRSIKLSRYTKV